MRCAFFFRTIKAYEKVLVNILSTPFNVIKISDKNLICDVSYSRYEFQRNQTNGAWQRTWRGPTLPVGVKWPYPSKVNTTWVASVAPDLDGQVNLDKSLGPKKTTLRTISPSAATNKLFVTQRKSLILPTKLIRNTMLPFSLQAINNCFVRF